MTKERVQSIVRYLQNTYKEKRACVHVTTSGNSTFYLDLSDTFWKCEDDVLHYCASDGDVWIEYESIACIDVRI